MDPLSQLFKKYGSDKGGEHLSFGRSDTCHNYGVTYHDIFKDRRHQVRHVLEIGIAHGSSLRAWRDYFPNAEIVGIDIDERCLFQEERIRCYQAHQGNALDLHRAMHEVRYGPFDLVVDDGSHEPADQIFSARKLLRFLMPDGLYVIEDIEPDCRPELIGEPVVDDCCTFEWQAMPTGHGIGRAHCQCGCDQGEQLVVFKRRGDLDGWEAESLRRFSS